MTSVEVTETKGILHRKTMLPPKNNLKTKNNVDKSDWTLKYLVFLITEESNTNVNLYLNIIAS